MGQARCSFHLPHSYNLQILLARGKGASTNVEPCNDIYRLEVPHSTHLRLQRVKLVNVQFFQHPIFQGRYHYTQITSLNIYLHNEIKHNVHIKWHGNYIEVSKKIKINSLKLTFYIVSYKFWEASLRMIFEGLGVHPLTQTPCWLRLGWNSTLSCQLGWYNDLNLLLWRIH